MLGAQAVHMAYQFHGAGLRIDELDTQRGAEENQSKACVHEMGAALEHGEEESLQGQTELLTESLGDAGVSPRVWYLLFTSLRLFTSQLAQLEIYWMRS